MSGDPLRYTPAWWVPGPHAQTLWGKFGLARGSDAVNHGFSKLYQRYFLHALRQKALEKRQRYPDLPDAARTRSLATLRDSDDMLTAPIHGFANADDYYARSSSINFPGRIRRW